MILRKVIYRIYFFYLFFLLFFVFLPPPTVSFFVLANGFFY